MYLIALLISSIAAPGQYRTHLWRWSKHMERPDFLSGYDVGRFKLWDRGYVPKPSYGHSKEVF